jgi:NAD(P)-dependent dehydrogenase (short-subunit alcohol dehydrogenase family)
MHRFVFRGPTPLGRRAGALAALALAALLAAGAPGCAPPANQEGPGHRSQTLALTPEQELSLGRQAYAEVLKKYRVVRRGPDVDRVREVGERIARAAEIEPEEFARATAVTYLGVVWGTMAALRRMRPRDSGTIVEVGSALAYRGIPLQSAYCGSKHAIKGFMESLRSELMHYGSRVHVTMVQLPALNTPQFEIGRTKMNRHPQPVPPIYQPEVAADAIVWASEHRRREIFVGGPTVKTIWGNKLAPALADRYLARNGFEAQLTDQPLEGGRPGNLFEPVPGDHGTHGHFEQARERSVQLALAKRRGAIAAIAGTLALGAAAAGALKAAR